MNSKDYATLALNVVQCWGRDLPHAEAFRIATKLIYHQRRLPFLKEKQIEKVLVKCQELTGTTWEEESGKLIGPFVVPD